MRTATGKGNSAQKILSYYRVNFNFSAPYQVLCDGPIIFQSFKNDIFLKQSLPTLFGAPTYPVVTNCIVNELRHLGEEFSNSAIFAKRASRIPCAHDGELSASECLMLRAKTPLDTNLIIATNDAQTLFQIAKIPGIPVVSIANQTKLVLKKPSPATIAFVQQHQDVKSDELHGADKALLKKVADEIMERRNLRRKSSFKPKRAKGPNSLSVKKPKLERDITNAQSTEKSVSDKCATVPQNSTEEVTVENRPDSGTQLKNASGTQGNDISSPAPELTTGSRKRRRRRRPSGKNLEQDSEPVTKEAGADGSTADGEAKESIGRRRRKRRKKVYSATKGGPANNSASQAIQHPTTSNRIQEESVRASECLTPKDEIDNSQMEVSKIPVHNMLPEDHSRMPSKPPSNPQLGSDGNVVKTHVEHVVNVEEIKTESVEKPKSLDTTKDSNGMIEDRVPKHTHISSEPSSARPVAQDPRSVSTATFPDLGNPEIKNAHLKDEPSGTLNRDGIMADNVKKTMNTAKGIGLEDKLRSNSTEVETLARNEKDEEIDKGPKKKKQRKNRRRRPKKETDGVAITPSAVEAV